MPQNEIPLPEQIRWKALRHDLVVYATLLLIAMLLSVLHYRAYVAPLPDDKHPLTELLALWMPQNKAPASAHATVPAAKATSAVSHYEPPCAHGEIDCKIDSINGRLHPLQGAPSAVAKSLIVVSLAMLWFSTFTLVRRHHEWLAAVEEVHNEDTPAPEYWAPPHRLVKWLLIGASIVPAALFVLAMAGAYEPAVFVMALAAIYVAAEHYCGLEKTQYDLETGVSELGQHVGTLLNADGLGAWRVVLYKQYRMAKERIDAVVRHFDIDRAWSECHAIDDPWVEYCRRSETNKDLFLNVLAACKSKVQFVADLPMAMPTIYPRPPAFDNRELLADYFRELLGLAWNLAVFAEVDRRRRTSAALPCREGFCYLRIKISSAPSWMHVIDDKTYQVIERRNLAQPTVRELHVDIASLAEQIRLSDWARRNVRNFALRGTLGQEHLLSTMRSAALQECTEDDRLDINTLDPILVSLGLEAYLASGAHRDFVIVNTTVKGTSGEPAFLPSSPSARKMCIAAFDAFLQSSFPNKKTIRIRDLARALL
ncbi:MAG: hypothetical protein M3Y65_13060 [Pseudomonadota bacterium]|nr:hypothetical protein [Pseudomonadota bacterium]